MTSNVKAIRLANPVTWWGDATQVGYGTVQPGETPTEAAQYIGVYDIETQRKQLGYITQNGQFKAVNDYRLVHTGVPWTDDGVQEISRTVGNYVPLQNSTLFDMTSRLAEYLQLEGVGMLGQDGEITFVQYQMGQFDVGGNPNERHDQWLLFGDDKAGGGFNTGQVTTRVVCQNTWRMALRDIEPLLHTNDLAYYLEYAVKAYYTAQQEALEKQTMLNAMFTRKLGTGEFNTGLQKVIPAVQPGRNLRNLQKLLGFDLATYIDNPDTVEFDAPETAAIVAGEVKRFVMDCDRVEDRRNAIADAFFTFNAERPYAADTAFAFFNAVTYVSNHGDQLRKPNGRPLFHADNSGASLMWRERADLNNRAWAYATGLLT